MDLDRNGLCILVPDECLALLATGRVGRIALSHNALPTIMPVMYEVAGNAVTFRSSDGLLVTAAERGDIVCFESDFSDVEERALWSVLVVGRLEIAPATDCRPHPFGSTTVSLPVTIISGRASVDGLSLARRCAV